MRTTGNHVTVWLLEGSSNGNSGYSQNNKTGKAPSSQAVHDALNVIDGRASYEGAEHKIHVRVAAHGESIYIDLGNRAWQAVEITSAGWRVIENPPVRFRRAKAMLPLPHPVPGGSVEDLRRFLNVTADDWPLVASWLLAAMRPTGPYPVLCLHGEQGSGKSTEARVLRSLIDPNTAALRSEPRDSRDLMIAANNGWVVALDNLSSLYIWLSDAICRLSTGGGFSTRTLYENDEETIFDAMRPVILTGIEELPFRGDLLDRSLLVNLPVIPEDRRRPESAFWADFEAARPAIFGAMLDAVSEAIKKLPTTTLSKLPRMADYALWATAGESGLGLAPGAFLDSYTTNRTFGNELAIESSPVGKVIVEAMETTDSWAGTATELLEMLEGRVTENIRKLKSWPKGPTPLSGCIRRLAPNLRQLGIDVTFAHRGRGRSKRRCIDIRKRSQSSVPNDPNVPISEKHGCGGDGGDASAPGGDAAGTQTRITVSPYEATVGTHGDDGDAELQPLSDEVVEWTG